MSHKAIAVVGAIISLLTLSAIAGCSSQQQEEKIYPYPFDSAIIEYEIAGIQEGTSTVSIKGDKFVYDTITNQTDNLSLYLEDEMHQIDRKTGTSVSSKNPIYEQLKKLPKEERMKFLTNLGVGLSTEEGSVMPKSEGTAEYAGQTCDIYKNEGFGEICLWNGIPLYSKINVPGEDISNTVTAVSIQLNPNIPDTVFEVPSE